MQKITSNGGYVGILMLLLGMTIIVFVLVRTDLFQGNKKGENKSIIEQSTNYINEAKEVKNLVEQKALQSTKSQ